MKLLLLIFLSIPLLSIDVVKISEYNFVKPDSPDNYLLTALRVCIINQNSIVVSDAKNYNLNVYRKGKFLQKFGSKGVGPNEFLYPRRMVYKNGLLYVYDSKARKLITLRITDEGLIDTDSYNILIRDQCFDFDVDSSNNIIQVSEYYSRTDKGYCLKNPLTNEYMVSYKMFMGEFLKDAGAEYLVSQHDNHIYLVWVNSLSTLGRYDTKTEEFTRLSVNTSWYKPIAPSPVDGNKIINMMIRGAPKKKIRDLRDKARKGKYLIWTLQTFKNFVCVTCGKHCLQTDTEKEQRLIIASHSGKIIKEFEFPKCHKDSYQIVTFNKGSQRMYVLTVTERDDMADVNCKVYAIR